MIIDNKHVTIIHMDDIQLMQIFEFLPSGEVEYSEAYVSEKQGIKVSESQPY